MTVLDGLLTRLTSFVWDGGLRGSAEASALLETLASPEILTALLRRLRGTPELRASCEHKTYQDKLVLFRGDEERSSSVVLHLFREGHFERTPWLHNHRAAFAARILRGSYLHTLWSIEGPPRQPDDAYRVTALYHRTEQAGEGYYCSETAFHSVRAAPATITLLLRAPARSERALYMREDGTGAFWRHAVPPAGSLGQDRATRPMLDHELSTVIEALERHGIVGRPYGS